MFTHVSAGVFKAFLLYTERHGNSTNVSALFYEDLNYWDYSVDGKWMKYEYEALVEW
jgi:hypothetical protein